MRYQHSFRVRAPLVAVADFHAQSASMGAITPPPVVVQIHQAPARLSEGDTMDFTLWLGPLPIRWVARIESGADHSFVDRQLAGPFAQWVHCHRFVPIDPNTTTVVDEIKASLCSHPWRGLVGLGMWLSLPLLFAYRGWKTKRLLEKSSFQPALEPSGQVVALLQQRQLARAQQDWAKADLLSQQIIALDWQVLDTPQGPRLEPFLQKKA